MHYQIDGRSLRTGAANFSASGLKRQDNDLIIIDSTVAATEFKQNRNSNAARFGRHVNCGNLGIGLAEIGLSKKESAADLCKNESLRSSINLVIFDWSPSCRRR
jgi:hypothetical protein